MSTRTPGPWVPPAGAEAWQALSRALRLFSVPCQGEPEAWVGEDLKARQEAAQACGTCPLVSECRDYSRAAGEQHGVWAGVDRGQRPAAAQREAS